MDSPEWAKKIVRDVYGQTPEEMLEKGYKRILEPNKGDVVYFHDTRGDGSIRAVKITGGYYFDPTFGRVSNFWDWNEMGDDGSVLEETNCGYGNFYIKKGSKLHKQP
jgi:hypothetical protein